MRRPRGRDDGVAAVEFALVFTMLLAVIALVYPLGEMLVQKMALDRAMSDVIRYATATPNSAEYNPDDPTYSVTGRRPTCAQVTKEFYRAANVDSASQGNYTVTIPACPSATQSGQTVSITVSKPVSLGPLGDLLSFAGITHSSSVTVSAGASGREE
ncbi:MAG TPA: TadE/TadG family type IV pilus assembly protein [Mycobacteriales bacterium]|nr:TadE/TadG family type IV pilus assembly protein [Mycobacteriales bacterium]